MSEANNLYKFFISYRRDDYPDIVEHIRSWFSWRYGRANVFMDFDSIPVGVPFPDHIKEQIRACDVVLVIISPNWLKRILDDPFREDDWVRIEIAEALNLQKLVIPIYIKGASVPDMNKLPAALRGMLNIQGAWLDSGQNFIDRIDSAMNSIENLLETKYSRRKEIRRMEEISPAAGLALGYYVNFVKVLGSQIVILNDNSRREKSGIQLTINGTKPNNDRLVKMNIIIPSTISLLQPDLLMSTRKTLAQAEIQSKNFGRPLSLYALVSEGVCELIDFPTTVAVLAHWIKRKLEEEGLNPESAKAQQLEEDELDRFEKALTYFIDDNSNDPLFRNYVQAIKYTPKDPNLKWLSDIWK